MGVMQVMRSLLMAQPHRESIVGTNGVATFDDDFKGLMKLSVPFTPIQAAGTPSPENPLPISGWTGAAINNAGANLLNGTMAANILKTGKPSQVSLGEDEDGKYVRLMGMSGADVNLTKTLKFKENTRYTVILTGKNESSGVTSTHIRFIYSDGNSTEVHWSNPTEIKTIAVRSIANKTVKAITTVTRMYNTKIYYEKPFGIFEGVVSASSFEEYQGQSIPITFTDPSTGDPMTVYGGTLTLNEDGSADLVTKFVRAVANKNNIGIFPWAGIGTDPDTGEEFARILFRKSGPNHSAMGMKKAYWCDSFPTGSWGKVYSCAVYDGDYYGLGVALPTSVVGTTMDECLAYMEGKEFVYVYRFNENRYPQFTNPTHFDNVGQLKSFIGQNNVWTDLNGDPTVGYWKHG